MNSGICSIGSSALRVNKMQVSVQILADGRIEIKSDKYPVQYVEPGGKRFGVTYDEYRAHGDGPLELGRIIDVSELYEGHASSSAARRCRRSPSRTDWLG